MTSDPRKFVRLWLTHKEVTVDERGGLQSSEGRDYDQILNTIILDYNEQMNLLNYKSDKKVKLASDTHLQKALEEFISYEVMEKRKKIFEKIVFFGAENLSSLEKFVMAMTGKTEPQVIAVFAHFLWTIKRKLLNKEVVWPIMPIILGKQSAGKSYSIEKLISPLNSLSLEISLTEVIDPRFHVSFSKNFIVLINEMAGANRTDVEKLKNLITTKHNDVRKLHTSTVTKVKQNVSLIGTTNRPVGEIIYDTTGARRFYEIKSLDKMDWPTIKSGIDYYQLWQGINENREEGYYEEHQASISADQEDLIAIDEIQVFLDSLNIKPGTKEIATHLVYSAYRTWCENNGSKLTNSSWFTRKLRGKGFKKPAKKQIKGKITDIYFINEDSEMHERSVYNPMATPAKEWV